ncbi:DUF2934 domain-containing protein [Tundrisphaera lichenicola]|uniref:DUF2934 domain-containing protein n=1 Tax=Tundrisphaera lichenicola TaxID=2029860 RepID=UPI003EB8EA85
MFPTNEQIGMAAYYRWVRRHYAHGRHDHDWLAAEQELRFSLNYEVVSRHRLDGVGTLHLGDSDDRRCRFCEQTAPRVSFQEPRLVIPSSIGNSSLLTFEECDDCHVLFRESLAFDLDWFVQATRFGDETGSLCFVPVAAFKGLIRSALLLLPEEDLQFSEDTIEWVGNPDHELDSRTFEGVDCFVHTLPEASPFSWAALARRTEEDAPMPYILAFFGVGHHVFQVSLPLCSRDEDLEGEIIIPRLASPFGVGRGPLDSRVEIVSLSSADPRRDRIKAMASH